MEEVRGLNLGCWNRYVEGMVNLDIIPPADVVHDLTVLPWPFQDSSFDIIIAHDLLEHLPVGFFSGFMNECHRLLDKGGRLDLVVPTPSDNFWIDPTHVRPYTRECFEFFCAKDHSDDYLATKKWRSIDVTVLKRPQVPAIHVVMQP